MVDFNIVEKSIENNVLSSLKQLQIEKSKKKGKIKELQYNETFSLKLPWLTNPSGKIFTFQFSIQPLFTNFLFNTAVVGLILPISDDNAHWSLPMTLFTLTDLPCHENTKLRRTRSKQLYISNFLIWSISLFVLWQNELKK